jgi:hypothetical protein
MKFLEQRLRPVDVLASVERQFAPLERRRRERLRTLRDRIAAEAPPTRIVAPEATP